MKFRKAVLSLLLCSLAPAFSAEPQSVLFLERREDIIAMLGKPQVSERQDADVFLRNGWKFVIQFENDWAKRVKTSKLDRAVLSDQEIRPFMPQIHPYATWKSWNGTSRRAWFFYGGKHPTYNCVVGEDGRSLLRVCPTGKETPPDLSDF